MTKTIKHRIFITFGSLSAFICMLFAGLVWLIAAETEDQVVKQVMKTEVNYLVEQYQLTNQLLQPRVDYMRLYPSEQELPAEILAGFRRSPTEKEFYAYGDNYHIEQFSFPDGGSYFITLNASNVEGLSTVGRTIWYSLLTVFFIVLIVALVLAWILSNRSAKPLQQLSHTIGKYKFGDALPELPEHLADEIGTLSRSFKSAFLQITDLLNRERAFTRDVSHELRTPMTLIKNTLQLNQQQPLDSHYVEIIEHASTELEQTVDVLLALARQENLKFSQVKLTPVIESCVLEIYRIYPDVEFNVDINVSDQFSVYGNEYLIKLLCQNLINNAFYHSDSKTMVILANGSEITFENPLEGGQEKPSYQGLGHGHYLVKRIVEEMGWLVSADKFNDHYKVVINTQSEGHTGV